MEPTTKRRKLSLKEKRLTTYSAALDKQNIDKESICDIDVDNNRQNSESVDLIHQASVKLNFQNEEDQGITDSLQDLRRKLLKLRKTQKLKQNENISRWPALEDHLFLDQEVLNKCSESKIKGSCVSQEKKFSASMFSKPCFKCLTCKPYPEIDILQESIKMQQNTQYTSVTELHKSHDSYNIDSHINNNPVTSARTDIANFNMMDISLSDEEMLGVASTEISNIAIDQKYEFSSGLCTYRDSTIPQRSNTVTDHETVKSDVKSECKKDLLSSCPMCQLVFDSSYGSLEVDSHLAQCLAAAGDDIAW